MKAVIKKIGGGCGHIKYAHLFEGKTMEKDRSDNWSFVYDGDIEAAKAAEYYSSNTYYFRMDQLEYAEIVDQPKEEIKTTITRHSEGPTMEPKAGDMVEFLKWISDNRWIRRDSTHPNKAGQYWSDVHCAYQTPEQLIELFLPQKSEVESKAREILNKWYLPPSTTDKQDLEMAISLIKWGQQNPDKK